MGASDPKVAHEEWFYEFGGRVRGPLAWKQLEELIAGSGETAREIRIRKGRDGPWAPFPSRLSPTVAEAHPASLADARPIFAPITSQGAAPRLKTGLGDWIGSVVRRNPEVLIAGSAFLLINLGLLLFMPEPYKKERGYLAAIEAIDAEAAQLRSRSASEQEWGAFAKESKQKLAPIVADLRKSASAAEPGRQQLLWAARDILPKTFGPSSGATQREERRLKECLRNAAREIERRSGTPVAAHSR